MTAPWLVRPIASWELRRTSRRRGTFFSRTTFALVTGTTCLFLASSPQWRLLAGPAVPGLVLRECGQVTSIVLAGTLTILATLFAATRVSDVIAREREKGTLDGLLLTRLTTTEIVGQMLVGRLLPTLAATVSGLPFVLAAGWAAGFPPLVLALVALAPFTTAAVAGAVTIYGSSRYHQVAQAATSGPFLAIAWFFLPGVAAISFPIPDWLADVVMTVKAIARFIGLSTPFSLALERTWDPTDPTYEGLQGRLLVMFAMQAAIGAMAFVAAVRNLSPTDLAATWRWAYGLKDRVQRPPCSDDPIVWREHELRMRGQRLQWVWVFLMLPRGLVYLLALLRSAFVVALGLFGLLFLQALMVGLVGGLAWFSVAALRECWQTGWDANGPYTARTHLNLFVRLLSFMLLIGGFAGVGSVGSSVMTEKLKKTWDLLLLTSLTGEEVLEAKTRAAFRRARPAAWLIGIVWLIGVVCGAVHPLGVAWAVVQGAATARALPALGFRGWLPPRPTLSMSPASALALMWLMLLTVALSEVALSSSRDLAVFGTWPAGGRWAVIGVLCVAPPLTSALGAYLGRENIRRFDEWVDRPRRPRERP